MKKKRHHIWKNILIMAAVFLVASGSSFILQKTGVHEHITAIFIFAVFLTSILTDGYIYGIVSALVGTLAQLCVYLSLLCPGFQISEQHDFCSCHDGDCCIDRHADNTGQNA